MKKDKAIEIIKKLKPSDKYVVTVSVLKEDKRIYNDVSVNNFLTMDLPVIRNKLSEEMNNFYQSAITAETAEAISVPVTESNLKSMLE
jgi:hypothetical protein